MAWAVENTSEFRLWASTLSERELLHLVAAINRLGAVGPMLGRPWADTLHGSRVSNLKELRPTQTMRVLFAFDPRRTAILLVGGDKTGRKDWYREAIRRAEYLWAEHLDDLKRRGVA